MKNIYTRKIVLLAAIAVLAVVYAVQLLTSARTNVKIVSVDSDITRIKISGAVNELTLEKEGDAWFAGAEKNPCQAGKINAMVNAVSEIKVLGNVASGSESDSERYGFDSAVTVEAYSGDKLLRTLSIGKITATGSQCYVRIDGKNAVLLAQGALRSSFEVSFDDIKEKPAAPASEENQTAAETL